MMARLFGVMVIGAASSATIDPAIQLQTDLNAAVRRGDGTFTIAPGTYRFQSTDLLVDAAHDLAIGSGSSSSNVTLLFTCNWGLVLRSCSNVSVSGIVVDYDPPCYSQGLVTNTGLGTVRYTVDDGFPTPDSNPRFMAMRVKVINWDRQTQLSKNARLMNQSVPVKRLGNRSYEIGCPADPNHPRGEVQVGQVVTVAPRMGHTVLLTNCSGCTVDGLTVHGASDMALVEYGGAGRNVWRGNRVVRNPAKIPMGLLVSNADIFQSSGVEVGPLVEGNEFTYAGDDCMNIHNYLSVTVRQDAADPRRLLLLDGVGEADMTGAGFFWHQRLNTFARVVPGDVARVYDSHNHSATMGLHLTTVVHDVTESLAPADLAAANATLVSMGLIKVQRNWVGELRAYWVTFRDPVPKEALPHALVNVDRLSGRGSVVRENSLLGCNSVHFKSIGGRVTANIFNHTGGVGIIIWPQWLEGSAGLRNVAVTDNVFLNHQSVVVGPGTQNITVARNHDAAPHLY
jgi:hypothetical protein